MGELFIDTDGEMTFENRERLNFVMHFVKKGAHYSTLETKDGVFVHEDTEISFNEIWLPCAQAKQSKIEQLEKQQRINSECINNLVQQKADYLYKVTKAIGHLDSFDHSRAGMNQLVRSIESALEALRGES